MHQEITIYGNLDGQGRWYRLHFRDDPDLQIFLENDDGEGMSMSEKNLFDVLHEHFKNNF